MKIRLNSIFFNVAACFLLCSLSEHVWAGWTDYGPWISIPDAGIDLSVRIKGEICDGRSPQSYQHWYEVLNNSSHNVTYNIGITNLNGVNVGVTEEDTVGAGQMDTSAGNWWFDRNCAVPGAAATKTYIISIVVVAIDGVSLSSSSSSSPSHAGQGASANNSGTSETDSSQTVTNAAQKDVEALTWNQQSGRNGGNGSATPNVQPSSSAAAAGQSFQNLGTALAPLAGLDVEDKEATVEFMVSGGIGGIVLSDFRDKIGELAQVSSVFGYGAAAGLRLFPLQFGEGDYALRFEVNGQGRFLTGNTSGYGNLDRNLTDYDLNVTDITIEGSAIAWWGWLGAGAKYKYNDITIGITDSYDSTSASIFNQQSELTTRSIVPELLLGSFDQRSSGGSFSLGVDSDLAASLDLEADYFWIKIDYYPFTLSNSNGVNNGNGFIGDMFLGARIPF